MNRGAFRLPDSFSGKRAKDSSGLAAPPMMAPAVALTMLVAFAQRPFRVSCADDVERIGLRRGSALLRFSRKQLRARAKDYHTQPELPSHHRFLLFEESIFAVFHCTPVTREDQQDLQIRAPPKCPGKKMGDAAWTSPFIRPLRGAGLDWKNIRSYSRRSPAHNPALVNRRLSYPVASG